VKDYQVMGFAGKAGMLRVSVGTMVK